MTAPDETAETSDLSAGRPPAGAPADRLEGWKAIARYLGRDIRTVQRWEDRERLPVHRHEHQKRATAFSYRSELEEWLRLRSPGQVDDDRSEQPRTGRGPRGWWWALGGLGVLAVALSVGGVIVGRRLPTGLALRDTRDAGAFAAFAEGQALYAARRYQDAVVALERAVSRDETYWSAWALLAKTHARLAPPAWAGGTTAAQRATEAAGRAARLAPNATEVLVALAMAARSRGDVDEWRREARRATTVDPRAAEAYALLGDSYSSMVYACGRDLNPELADAYYQKALELKPDLTTAVSNRGTNLRRMGRYADCIELVDRARRSLSDENPLLLVRGGCRLMQGDINGAAADLEPLRDNPKLSPVGPRVLLGLLSLKRGDTPAGVRDLEAVARVQPGALSELYVAEAYAAAEDVPHLIHHLTRAFEMDATCRSFVAASPAFRVVRNLPPITRLLSGEDRR